MPGGTLMLHLQVELHRREDGALLLEDQAINGLRLWLQHFERLILTMMVASGPAPPQWQPLATLGPLLDRIEIVELPVAWRPDRFLRHLPAQRRRIRDAISRADHLSFAIGGLFGDWGAVGCLAAASMGRPYAVWTDRVESQVARFDSRNAPHWRRRLRTRLTWRAMAALERHVISRATLGLFHGRETYDHFAPLVRQAELVHDIHVSQADHIDDADLAAKLADTGHGSLRIIYVGRADPEKGPDDWLEVLTRLRAQGVDFTATWLGDGSRLQAMRARVAGLGLADQVQLPGFATDRGKVLAALRGAQVLMFCHKTPESPRVLIESLFSGTPLAGYHGAFAEDLISEFGGGVLVPPDDLDALTTAVAGLAHDRRRLAALIAAAARDGMPFTDEAVFAHRSELIHRYLPRSK